MRQLFPSGAGTTAWHRRLGSHPIVQRLTGLAVTLLWPQFEAINFSIGQMQSRLNKQVDFDNIGDAEFRVFSQFGGDGLLQYILGRIPPIPQTFVELGAGNYRESNTRFLVQNDAWEGLVVDAGTAHLKFLDTPWIRWPHRVNGRSAFITAENVNDLIRDGGFAGNLGLLSVDIDGNDYWILKALDAVAPVIIVVEYNSLFGPIHPVVVPYSPEFVCGSAHPSHLYFGASLLALARLATEKGYKLVASDKAGVNAYFVRRDVASRLTELSVEEAWVPSQHRMPTDPEVWLPAESLQRARLRLIQDLPLCDVSTGTTCLIRNRYDLT